MLQSRKIGKEGKKRESEKECVVIKGKEEKEWKWSKTEGKEVKEKNSGWE